MKITVEMFKLLCIVSRIDVPFMILIAGMGKKSEPKDEHFMSSYSQFYGLPVEWRGKSVQYQPLQRLSFSEILLVIR
jgi:hypothetical protein